MSIATPETADWLSNESTRLLLSDQMRAIGRLMLRQLQARHLPPGFTRLLTRTLRQPGKLLSSPVLQGELLIKADLRGWVLPTLLAAISAAGKLPEELPRSVWRRARAVGAATELLGAALDVIDDIQDGDSPFVNQIGAPVALNVGVALLELAPLALGQARGAGWPESVATAALELLHSSTLTSLGGQYLDLRFEQQRSTTEEQVLEMTGKKSGTLLALIYRLGAMAGVSQEQQRPLDYFEAVSLFGWYLGAWSQLLNDLHDAEQTQAQSGKSDRTRHKKTLPLFFEHWGMIEEANEVKDHWSLTAQAAFSYTYAVAETYRLRAQKALQTLEERFGPHPLLWPLLTITWEEKELPAG